jgi:DNA phosphorothioation-associated putative methyltransferase
MTGIMKIARHKTAIGRAALSRPFRTLIDANLLNADTTVFDYGCGRGDDLRCLAASGLSAKGWDPVHMPSAPRTPADVVNLGYVINVIEDQEERAEVVRLAWDLTKRLLVVSARLQHEAEENRFTCFADGCLTARGTFQKFFGQIELRDWLKGVLGEEALAAAPGVYFVFRDPELCHQFIQARYHRRRSPPVARISDILFQKHQDILTPLMEFIANRGRLPSAGEMPHHQQIADVFGSVPRAFSLVRRVTGAARWEQLRHERIEELLIQLALDRFAGRPRFSALADDLQIDIREFFSTYTKACTAGDELLFRAGKMAELNVAMSKSPVGKLTGNALYVHTDALPLLSPILRVYEGCARSYLGHVDGANVVKLNRIEPKISYLLYPDFDSDPHPQLLESLRVNLGNRDVKHTNFRNSTNPPILHRKEEFLPPDDERRPRFERLTKQEEKFGLFKDPSSIGTRDGWHAMLAQCGVTLKGHRVIRLAHHAP